MQLNDIIIDIGEMVWIDPIYVFRNEYAYLILKQYDDSTHSDTVLLIDDEYYCVETVEDLRSYKLDDFL